MTSIRYRLSVVLLLGLLVLSATAGCLLYWHVRAALTHQFDSALLARAEALGNLLKLQHDGRIEFDFADESMPEFAANGHSDYFQIWASNGSVIQKSRSLKDGELPRNIDPDAGVKVGEISLPTGRTGRAGAVRVVPGPDKDDPAMSGPTAIKQPFPTVGSPLVLVARDRSDLDPPLTVLLSALLLTGGVMAVGVYAIVTIALGRCLAPLERVAREAAGVDANSLGFRFSIDRLPDELRPICLRLNESLEKLETAFQRQRLFTGDVAHELRTPIAELRSLADVGLQSNLDQETARTFFRDAQEIAKQMESMVASLLSLARSESGTLAMESQPVRVAEVVRETWRQLSAKAAQSHLTADFAVAASLVLVTSRPMLSSIVNNLLSNAVSYTPPGGKIACAAQAKGLDLILKVTNTNESLSEQDLQHLFEPFWRRDPARTDSSHFGLGLSVVAAYAKALGGSVEAQREQPGALSILLRLPGLTDEPIAGQRAANR